METLSTYQYSALAPQHVRFLQVSKRLDKDERIQCEFTSVALDDLDTAYYTAISYLWGSPEKIAKVWCGNSYIEVTQSAMSILEDVAAQPSSRNIWIDAVCIDQGSLVEKEAQIRLMRHIYGSADNVIVWLIHGDFSDEAIEFVVTLYKALTGLHQQNVPVTLWSLTSAEDCAWPSSRWTALSRFLKNPWFNRIWIIQEIAVPKTAIKIVCGNSMLPWQGLAEVSAVLQGRGLFWLVEDYTVANQMAEPEGLESVTRTYGVRLLYQDNRRPTLANLLLECWNAHATDGRDKVFALIGLASDANGPEFDPDYTSPLNEILERVAATILTRDFSSARILHAAGVGLLHRSEDIPSWVPDWTNSSFKIVLGSIQAAGYQACGDDSDDQILTYDQNNHTIKLSGHITDNVSQIAQPFPVADATNFDHITLQQESISELDWIQKIRDLYPDNTYPNTTDPLFPVVLSLVLIANMVTPGIRAPAEYVDYFTEYIKFKEGVKNSTSNEEWNTGVSAEAIAAVMQYATALFMLYGNIIFQTERLYLGIGAPGVKVGDQVCIFRGFITPFIIRRRKDGMFDLVGECYVHGLMDGEGITMSPEGDIVLA